MHNTFWMVYEGERPTVSLPEVSWRVADDAQHFVSLDRTVRVYDSKAAAVSAAQPGQSVAPLTVVAYYWDEAKAREERREARWAAVRTGAQWGVLLGCAAAFAVAAWYVPALVAGIVAGVAVVEYTGRR